MCLKDIVALAGLDSRHSHAIGAPLPLRRASAAAVGARGCGYGIGLRKGQPLGRESGVSISPQVPISQAGKLGRAIPTIVVVRNFLRCGGPNFSNGAHGFQTALLSVIYTDRRRNRAIGPRRTR